MADLELNTCYSFTVCSDDLGIVTGVVLDSMMSASSSYNFLLTGPGRARVNDTASKMCLVFQCCFPADYDEQMKLLKNRRIVYFSNQQNNSYQEKIPLQYATLSVKSHITSFVCLNFERFHFR